MSIGKLLEQDNWATLPDALIAMRRESDELASAEHGSDFAEIVAHTENVVLLEQKHDAQLAACVPGIFTPLTSLLFGENTDVAHLSAGALYRFACDGLTIPENVIEKLGEALSLPDMHASASDVLQVLVKNNESILPAKNGLLSAFDSIEDDTRLECTIKLIGALGENGAAAKPKLLSLLTSRNTDIRSAVEIVLLQITGREPEEVILGKNIIEAESQVTSTNPTRKEDLFGELVVQSWDMPHCNSREMIVVDDKLDRLIYGGLPICLCDLEGNSTGKIDSLTGEVAMTMNGELLISARGFLYRLDSAGTVLEAQNIGYAFGSFDVLSNEVIAGIVGAGDETFICFVNGKNVNKIKVSEIHWGRVACRGSDGYLFVAGSMHSSSFWAGTVFKLSSSGQVMKAQSMFENIGAICPTLSGGVDVIELDGDRLVRLSADLDILYDSNEDSGMAAQALFQSEYFVRVNGMDADKFGNCYIASGREIAKLPIFWA